MRTLLRHLRRSFTLTELLILIAIIAILFGLVGMLLPALHPARERVGPNDCLNNLHQVGIALDMYSQMNGGFYPYYNSPDAMDSLALLYPDLMPSSQSFRCKRTSDLPVITVTLDANGEPAHKSFGNGKAHSSYGYDRTIGARNVNPNMPIAGDMDGTSATNPKTVTANHRGGQNILFYDGHVKWVQVNTWIHKDGLTDNFYTADLAPAYEPDPPTGVIIKHYGDTDAFIQWP